MTMAGEVEKLRAELTNTANIIEKRTGNFCIVNMIMCLLLSGLLFSHT